MNKLNAYYLFAMLITIILTALKLIGQIEWPWMLIVLPIITPPILLCIVVVGVIAAMYGYEYYRRLKSHL